MSNYRYRDGAGGSTRVSLQRMKHIAKLGPITSIKGYRYRGRYGVLYEAVMVKGVKGSARFGGFCWGYMGEGPRGLIELLMLLGVPEAAAYYTANFSARGDNIGTDWELENNWRFKEDA